MANVEAAAENGERLGKKVQELFSFEAKDSWMQLSVQNAESRRTYTYAYKKILKPQETSETLFDTVKFLNLIEGQLDGQTLEIPVRAYAIQTSYTGGSSDNLPEQIKAAYEKYVNSFCANILKNCRYYSTKNVYYFGLKLHVVAFRRKGIIPFFLNCLYFPLRMKMTQLYCIQKSKVWEIRTIEKYMPIKYIQIYYSIKRRKNAKNSRYLLL